MPTRIAVIGVGHLGKEHARILAGLPEVELVGVADVNFEQAQAVALRVGTQAYRDYWPLVNLVDAACIVVPTSQHASVAQEFLRRGIPLLVEKPLARTLAEAEQLVQLAEQTGAMLQVGHIERFNPAFEDLARRPLQPKFIQCERLGPFTGRSTDIGVVLDLMIHDLDLVLQLAAALPTHVEALGMSVFGGAEDVAHARLRFADGCVAELTASRASPRHVRRMHIWAPEGFAWIDFAGRHLTLMQPSEHVRRHGLNPDQLDPAARARLKDELFIRHLEVLERDGQNQHQDQLTCELREFVHCVQTGSRPRVTGAQARDALAVAQRVLEQIRTHAWSGADRQFTGPASQPPPLGFLFPPQAREKVA